VNGIHDAFPTLDLLLSVDAGRVIVEPCLRVDERRLGDQDRARHRGALAVVLGRDFVVNVLLVGPEASERGQRDAVLQVHRADADGLEERGLGDCHGGSGWVTRLERKKASA